MAVFEEALAEGLAGIDLELSVRQQQQVAEHFAGVLRWNKVHNLTRVTDPRLAAHRHYVDSLAGFCALASELPEEARQSVVDVGSGAGFPGLVGAILWPKAAFVLLDSAAKRCSFLELMSQQLGLSNVRVFHADARQVEERWPLVVSRATFSSGHLDGAFGLREAGGRVALWIGDEAADAGVSDVGEGRSHDAKVLVRGTTRVALV